MTSRKHAFTLALVALTMVNVTIFYLAGHPFRAYLIENADLLYLPTLFSDLLTRGGHLSDWFLTPAPYFFPDYAIYLVAYLLGSGTYSRILLFSLAQVLVTFGALWFLAKQATRTEPLAQASLMTVALVWFALNAGEPFVILLASASHYGAFVAGVLIVALWLTARGGRLAPRRARLAVWMLCAVAFASTLSDSFFFVQVLLPLAAASAFVGRREERVQTKTHRFVPIAAWVVLGCVLPILVYRIPIPAPAINVAWSDDVDDRQRQALEAEYGLIEGDFRGEHLWTYRITDTTRANVGALVRNTAVKDTQHIDRTSFAVDGATGPLQRAVSTLPIGFAMSTLVVLGLIFLARAWRDRRQPGALKDNLLPVLPGLFGVAGALSYGLVVENHTSYSRSIGIEKAYGNASDLYALVVRTITGTPLYGVLFVAYLTMLTFVMYDRFTTRTERRLPEPLAWVVLFSFLSLCSTFVTASLLTDLPVMPRYVIPAFSWVVVVVVLSLNHYLGNRFFAVGTALSAIVAAAMSLNGYALARANGVNTRLYPADIACIDAALENEGLSNGIAQYWDAKYLQQFSRLDLRIAQYLENLEAMKWITSARYFRDSYDFAIIDEDAEPTYKISREALSRLNGSPKRIVSCGHRSLLIYGKDRLRTAAPPNGSV